MALKYDACLSGCKEMEYFHLIGSVYNPTEQSHAFADGMSVEKGWDPYDELRTWLKRHRVARRFWSG